MTDSQSRTSVHTPSAPVSNGTVPARRPSQLAAMGTSKADSAEPQETRIDGDGAARHRVAVGLDSSDLSINLL
jgi:hypothetical protein